MVPMRVSLVYHEIVFPWEASRVAIARYNRAVVDFCAMDLAGVT